ncbi:hypothetical protein [Cryobacterium sp. TMT2-23]|uniref:hypothetical protein n=1 Tax=Cryobacterium sp. TMT2-23 TaxID=1259252 RepID=UPI00106B7FFC|nr:hypothetical protein [Cryobacterium sp. TMT2-23]TFD20738.1 hypothetical protein E3T32_08165 [Cryobacterium sp. TMT2-23]
MSANGRRLRRRMGDGCATRERLGTRGAPAGAEHRGIRWAPSVVAPAGAERRGTRWRRASRHPLAPSVVAQVVAAGAGWNMRLRP